MYGRDYSREGNICQDVVLVDSSQAGLLLDGEKFDWVGKKKANIQIAKLYDPELPDYSRRAAVCCTWLEFSVSDEKRKLRSANFCQLRLCPLCSARKSRKAAIILSRVMEIAKAAGYRFLFLTLTVKNCSSENLRDRLALLTAAWSRFTRHRDVEKATEGYFRTIEITSKGRGYHPHIHALLAVKPDYFSGNGYITHDRLCDIWAESARLDYRPVVSIEAIKGGKKGGIEKAALEAAKYCVKGNEILSAGIPREERKRLLMDLTGALAGKRLTAYGGVMRKIYKSLNENEDDLVNLTGEIDGDVATLIEVYHWSFGIQEYVLDRVLSGLDG